MMDREKVIHAVKTAFDVWIDEYTGCSWFKEDEVRQAKEDALELLQEQDAVVKQWIKEIADNQLAHAPNDYPMSLDEQLENEYKRGIWDGLQIAWNIISEGR